MFALAEVIHSVTKLENRLHAAKFFDKAPSASNPAVRRPATRSTGRPPRSDDVERLGRLLKREIVDHFVVRPWRPNTSWLDNKAAQWLKLHKHETVVIDADKNLGDVLLPKSWVTSELRRLLDEGYQKLEADEYRRASFSARSARTLWLNMPRTHFASSHVRPRSSVPAFLRIGKEASDSGRSFTKIQLLDAQSPTCPAVGLPRPVFFFAASCGPFRMLWSTQ